jgi:tripartite-type tricarboxylate transporter receptor subunit TctC
MMSVMALCAATVLAPHAAAAQVWQPNKPIAIVIPFPPGPGLDLVARMVGDKLSASIGQPVVYENRTGASGSIAAEYVARAAPDGTTLMAAATSTHATNVHLIKNLSYGPVKNFTPIVESVETIGCIVVNTSVVPVNSVAELVAYAKANSGKLSFGSSGAGSFFHLAGELFNQVNGVNLAHVPYRGSVAAFTDLIGGHIQVNFTQLSQAVAYRDNKNLKVLAVLEEMRFSRWPEYPSITEALPSYKMPPTWNGIVGPAGLPEPIRQRLNAELNKALALPEVKRRLEDNGYRVVGGSGEAFGKRIRDDIAFYGPIFKSVGVQAQ